MKEGLNKSEEPEKSEGLSRRQAIRTMFGAAAGMALPVGALAQELIPETPRSSLEDRPVMVLNGYRIFASKDHGLGSGRYFKKKFKKPLEQVIGGIEMLNNIIGSRRKFIQKIFVISASRDKDNDPAWGAYVDHATPESANFFDDRLTSGSRLELLGFHEAVHSMDLQLGVSEHPLFRSLYSTLPMRFRRNLNESVFFPGDGEKLGHSEDDELELLATLLNSFNLVNWQEELEWTETDFLKNYTKSLATLEQVLKDCGGQAIPAGSPIFGIISERLLFAQDCLQKQ